MYAIRSYYGLWLFPNGLKKREEVYLDGKREGPYVEYDSLENVILKGEYFDDARVGEWIYQVGDITEKGSYELDEKTGVWKHYYNDTNRLRFTGAYKNGDEEGTHKWFYPNGNVELIGDYRIGKKHKDWKKYNVSTIRNAPNSGDNVRATAHTSGQRVPRRASSAITVV